ncbi:hypothetical protein BKN38_07815 [Helicobacter sp. CLO-3]|nr:hypothetical protein BKN38_07815 [Helicobacter sp. CLO-3]
MRGLATQRNAALINAALTLRISKSRITHQKKRHKKSATKFFLAFNPFLEMRSIYQNGAPLDFK